MSYSNSRSPISKPSSYINLNSFNYSSDPVDSLDLLFEQPWQIKSLQISSHGNNGVVFIETTLGSFVLKTNNQAPADLFFNQFAKLIDVNLERFCEKDQALSMRLRKRLDFPFYQIMEYVPSISFLQIGPERFQKHQLTQSKLRSMGICMGFDLIINNNDRFKLNKIWGPGNQGNIANIMIKVPEHFKTDRDKIKNRQDLTTKLGQYYFIDHGGMLLDIEKNKSAADNFKKYMERVTLFHDQMIQFLRKQLPCPQTFNGLISQIEFYTKYKLTEENLTKVIQGIIYSTTMFIEFFQQKAFDQIVNELKKDADSPDLPSQVKYWNDYWNAEVAKVTIKHLETYHLKVSAIYATFGEVVQGICESVAQKITQTKKNSLSQKPTRKNSQRSQSKNSILSQAESQKSAEKSQRSQKPKLTQQQSLKQFQDILGTNQQIQNPDDNYETNNSYHRSRKNEKEQPPKEQTKNRFKERLQKYTQKNYDENYQKTHQFSKRNIQSMESFVSNDQ